MRQRVADFIADYLAEFGIRHIFTVVGGGAMHLNDAFGNHHTLNCVYNHHEQASAMAAESYARMNNEMAVACVTTGPGGTNAVTGVLCAWQDNIPMLVISGQVRTGITVESTGLKLRQFGDQEHYIVDTVKSITKYAVMIKKPEDIKYHLQKALYLSNSGRRGPCWLDIPLDVQGAVIETEGLREFHIPEIECEVNLEQVQMVLQQAKRPVIIAGSAIRSAAVYKDFIEFIKRNPIPILAANGCNDLLPVNYKLYYGNFGTIGGRAGNFIVQNADCLLVLGCGLNFKHIGFQYEKFSPNSYKIVVDVDNQELLKKTTKINIPLNLDLKDFFSAAKRINIEYKNLDDKWIEYCDILLKTFPIYQAKFSDSSAVNPYYFAESLKKYMPDNGVIVVGNSCACDCVRQCGVRTVNQRLWGNTNCGTMGYDLPGAIGAAVAGQRDIYCVTGDGSIQMNLQELQTIVHNRLPIKIFIHNNSGYYAIVQTHMNFFGRLSGCTKESGISFPNFEHLAYAYGIPYMKASTHEELDIVLPEFIHMAGYGICEIISDPQQGIEPKSRSKLTDSGQIVSPLLDDLYPFLDENIYSTFSDFEAYVGGIRNE